MQQSSCDVTAYHAYNRSEIASSKMQIIENWVFVSQKKYKIYIQVPYHPNNHFHKNQFLPQKPPFKQFDSVLYGVSLVPKIVLQVEALFLERAVNRGRF